MYKPQEQMSELEKELELQFYRASLELYEKQINLVWEILENDKTNISNFETYKKLLEMKEKVEEAIKAKGYNK
jgi:hypothetical protein